MIKAFPPPIYMSLKIELILIFIVFSSRFYHSYLGTCPKFINENILMQHSISITYQQLKYFLFLFVLNPNFGIPHVTHRLLPSWCSRGGLCLCRKSEPLAPMSAHTAGLAPGRECSPLEEELKVCLGKPALPLTKLAV